MKKIFAGIDVSKHWIDVCVTTDGKSSLHRQFTNNRSGFMQMLKWLRTFFKDMQGWLVCMEHTGLYAQPLWYFLTQKGISYSVVAGSQITSGLKIRRGKSDQIDASDIARFTFRYRDELRPHQIPARLLERLKMLFGYRERLVKAKVLIQVPATEAKHYASEQSKEMRKDSASLVQVIESRIKKVEKIMLQLIESDLETEKCYKLIVSVPGFGLVTASYLLIITHCFTTLSKSRKLSNFGGMAPHPHKSGSSIRGKTRVSHVADKKLKTLLSRGAQSLIQYDQHTKDYLNRMLDRGKDVNLVRNNIKNKMLHTVCAVVKRGTPFIANYVSPDYSGKAA
jgi:transposase